MNLISINLKKNKKLVFINVIGNKNKISSQDQLRFRALEEGTFFARDLVSEPGNILHPDEYAKRINSLKKFGLKINIYDEKKTKKSWNECFARCRARKYQGILSCNYGMEWCKK